MAVYDPEARKLVARVVYDGPGMAGKTTNLQQLCQLFSRQRRSELYSGATAGERTLCLDWLQLDAGLVGGQELRCHLLSVPGQAVLSRRRQLLLSLADAIVFVLESTEGGLADARGMWLSMLACTGGPEAGVPIVVQANKQDRVGALSPEEIRVRWGIDPRVGVIAAQATGGSGVRETLVQVIRAAAVELQTALEGNGLGDLEGKYETGEELERRLLEMERARPMSPMEVVLAAHGLGKEGAAAPPAPGTRTEADVAFTFAALKPSASWGDDDELRARAAAPDAVARDAALPPLPDGKDHALVWPASEGRKTLRRVPLREAALRTGVTSGGTREPAAAGDGLIFEAGIWQLKTKRSRCFGEADQARKELVRLAQLQMELGKLRVPRTVLAVQADGRGGHWVWTVSLWLTTLRNQMTYAAGTEDAAALASALELYGGLALRSLRASLDDGLVLEIDPEKFGVLSGEGFYLDDDVERGVRAPGAGAALLRCFDEYSEHAAALASYLRRLGEGLEGGFRPGELGKLGVIESLEAAPVKTEVAESARRELLERLRRAHGSAA